MEEEPRSAWSEERQTKKNEERESWFSTASVIIKEYSEYSTIQGLIYIFFTTQTIFGRAFWAVIVLLMVALGIFWSVSAYLDWQAGPVLTTVATTAWAIQNVPFPAVTICAPGMNEDVLYAGFQAQFLDFLENYGTSLDFSPLDAVQVLNQDSSVLDSAENGIKNKIQFYLENDIFQDFLENRFPGLTSDDDILTFMKLMISKNPENDLGTIVAFKDRERKCSNSKRRKRQSFIPCPSGFVPDLKNGHCYKALGILYEQENAIQQCQDVNATPLQFYSEVQLQSFLALLVSKSIVIPKEAKIYLHASRSGNETTFKNKVKLTESEFPNIRVDFSKAAFDSQGFSITETDPKKTCVMASMMNNSTFLKVEPTSCLTRRTVICQIVENYEPCVQSLEKLKTLDYLLDPVFTDWHNSTINKAIANFKDMFQRLNQKSAYTSLIKNLWYSTLPCNDVRGISADKDGEASVLKYCEWKGQPVSCSAIFKMFPTDAGMCCSFNIDEADKIINSGTYTSTVKELQLYDRNRSFSTDRGFEFAEGEPSSELGKKKGLVILLDAHSDILSPGSVDSDFDGFTAVVGPKNSFPMLGYNGFEIKPGHKNIIALSATQVNADPSLRNLNPVDRNCMFANETQDLKIHQTYSLTNCLFECAYSSARVLMEQDNETCIPWFFPSIDMDINICDPWQTNKFMSYLNNDTISKAACSVCLPDCIGTIYEREISSVPFRRCDSSSLGTSRFCNIFNSQMSNPGKFAQQILDRYNSALGQIPSFVSNQIMSSTRKFGSRLAWGDILSSSSETYDAFDRDIAMVEVYFKTASVIMIQNNVSMTWVTFFSNIGGLLGLVLGMGIISLVEIIWLFLRIVSRHYNFTNWIN